MDELIIRDLQGHLTADEAQALTQWRRRSLDNERYYRSMERAWLCAEYIAPVAGERASAPIAPRAVSARRRLAGAAMAAAALLVLAVGLHALLDSHEPLMAMEFVTGRRETATVTLTDGTVVRLAPNSRLRVGDEGSLRVAWLEGHGFFAVARDAERSFVVRTSAGEALVLGTQFDVTVERGAMQVFVVEGRVEHWVGAHHVEVAAMELSRAEGDSAPEVSAVEDAKPLLSWMGEFLVFQATPLRTAAAELERRYGIEVHIADDDVAERTVSAWFSDEPLEQIVLIVCTAAEAQCSVEEDRVLIQR